MVVTGAGTVGVALKGWRRWLVPVAHRGKRVSSHHQAGGPDCRPVAGAAAAPSRRRGGGPSPARCGVVWAGLGHEATTAVAVALGVGVMVVRTAAGASPGYVVASGDPLDHHGGEQD